MTDANWAAAGTAVSEVAAVLPAVFERDGTTFGERHHNSRLTSRQVAQIRALLAASPRPTVTAVAQRFGLAKEHVSAIWKFKLWTRVGGSSLPFHDVRAKRPRRRPGRPRPRCDQSTIDAILAVKDGLFSQTEAARLFGVGRSTVGRVWRGERRTAS